MNEGLRKGWCGWASSVEYLCEGKAGGMATLARILNLKFWPEYMYGIPPVRGYPLRHFDASTQHIDYQVVSTFTFVTSETKLLKIN